MQVLSKTRVFPARIGYALSLLAFSSVIVWGQAISLPQGQGRETVQRVCGACHPATIVLGHGMTREGWGQVVASMITRGAKGSAADFEAVTNYLAKNLPANAPGGAGGARHSLSAGPGDRQVVDRQSAARGKTIYTSECASCHGPLGRGANGPDLVR